MGSSKTGRRVRRQFSEEFKEGAVRLVLDEGKSVGAVARELDLTAFAQVDSPGTGSEPRALCKDFSRDHRVQVLFEHTDVPGDIANDRALSLFRIVQETLHNVAKHSGVTRVAIDLKGTSDAVALSVFDNGKGFNPSEHGTPHTIGMQSIRERAHMMSGTVLFQSRPAVEGTRIAVMMPLENRPTD
jgi:signal transduction histidine kinase